MINPKRPAHVSSNGFVNYDHATSEQLREALTQVFERFPDAVVIDGEDDWYAPAIKKAWFVADAAKVKVLERFHTGVSGFSSTGIIIAKSDLRKFKLAYRRLAKVKENCEGKELYNFRFNRVPKIDLKIYAPNASDVLERAAW